MMKAQLIFEQDFATGYINVVSESMSYVERPAFDVFGNVEYIRDKCI
jgi:hypothetical protein